MWMIGGAMFASKGPIEMVGPNIAHVVERYHMGIDLIIARLDYTHVSTILELVLWRSGHLYHRATVFDAPMDT